MNNKQVIRPGNIICCQGVDAVVVEVNYQSYDEYDGWDVEFLDSKGCCRRWKQVYDGGYVVKPGVTR